MKVHSYKSFLPVLLLAGLATPASANMGLALERAGLGLKPPSESGGQGLAPRGESAPAWRMTEGASTAYGGLRDRTRLGLTSVESYGGIDYALTGRLGASLELATMEATALAPRRYSLSGQLHTAFDSGSSLSFGLAYRVYDPDFGASRPEAQIESAPTNGYSLVPVHMPGTGLGPSYQLQLHYQYNPATTFGLVLGRELETFASAFDYTGTAARQFSFTGQHWLTPSWALSYDVLSNDPGSLRLQGLRLGVRYRF